jgi:hypothetical protein
MGGNTVRAACITQASLLALVCAWTFPAHAQAASAPADAPPQASPPQAVKLQTLPPKGFDDVESAVSTDFDVTFQQRGIGSFRATFKDGVLSFLDPAALARALGPQVDTAAVIALLSKPLNSNEQYRCRPGQLLGNGCGELPSGMSGVIVNPDSFSVSLFLSRDYLISTIAGPRMLGPAMSGPSLIQTIRFAASKEGGQSVSYGGTFDTLASFGQTSLVGQTSLSDFEGLRTQQLYLQRIWSDRRAAVGLLQDYQSLLFTNYRLIGGEFGSFYGTLLDATNDTATPLEILLPQRAQVELYRDGVLISAGRYEAGLQLLNTRALPEGSYSVHIIARDGGHVLLDETRPFSKISNLVPPGKTAFKIRVGERAQDTFLDTLSTGRQGFLPHLTGELVANASVQRRLGSAMAGTVSITSFASKVYGEASLQVFRGRISGLAGGGVGSDGAYSGLISVNFQLPRVSFYVSARTMHLRGGVAPVATDDRYFPFYRSQDTLFASAQTRVLGGALSLTGSYSRSAQFPERYAGGLQYTRSVDLPWAGSALLTAGVTKSDVDTRFGITVSFFKRVDRKTTFSGTVGGQYVGDSQPGVGGRTGFSPVGEAVLSRQDRLGSIDAITEAGAGTDADGDRAFGRVKAVSPYGTADATMQWQDRRFGSDSLSYLVNGQTGFAIGGGTVKVGMRDPAESIVMVDLSDTKVSAETGDATNRSSANESVSGPSDPDVKVAGGGYRITIDGQAYDYIEPGHRVALGLPALKEYSIGLKPEGAPQFDIDITRRPVRVYPGNVVRLRFEAQQVISLFGQVLSASGAPMAGARIEAGSDFAVADDRGYFTVTAPVSAAITIRGADGSPCLQRVIATMIDIRTPSLLYRFGTLRCSADKAPTSSNWPEIGDREPARLSDAMPLPRATPPAAPPATAIRMAAATMRRTVSERPDTADANATAQANLAELARIRAALRSAVAELKVSDATGTSAMSLIVAEAFLRQLAGHGCQPV